MAKYFLDFFNIDYSKKRGVVEGRSSVGSKYFMFLTYNKSSELISSLVTIS